MNGTKRNRSHNWDSTDKVLLRQLVAERIDIIENKNVDTETSKRKREAWMEILELFNQDSNMPRSVAQIQCQWRGTKMQMKAQLSQQKRSLNATRGEPPPKSPDTDEADMLEFMPEELEVNYNFYDCDAITKLKKPTHESLKTDRSYDKRTSWEKLPDIKVLEANSSIDRKNAMEEHRKRMRILDLQEVEAKLRIKEAKKRIRLIELQIEKIQKGESADSN